MRCLLGRQLAKVWKSRVWVRLNHVAATYSQYGEWLQLGTSDRFFAARKLSGRQSEGMRAKQSKRLAFATAATLAIVAVAGCSTAKSRHEVPSYTPVPTPSATPPDVSASANPSSSIAAVGAVCTLSAVKSALPKGAVLNHYRCAREYVGAYAVLNGKQSGYIYRVTDGQWADVTTEVCAAPPAGLGPTVAAFCPKTPPKRSPSAVPTELGRVVP